MSDAALYAPLEGRAVLVHDCTSLDELSSTISSPSSTDWTKVLLSEELAPLVCRHLNARVVLRVCHTWRNLARDNSMAACQHMRDALCTRHVGASNALQTICGNFYQTTDISALAVLDGQAICAGDAHGLITLWRLSPIGEVGRKLCTLRHHSYDGGAGEHEGRIDQLLVDGDSLISTGCENRGRGSSIWVTTLIKGARRRLLEGDEREFASRATSDDGDDGGSSSSGGGGDGEAEYVTSAPLPVPFERGDALCQLASGFSRLMGFRASLANGRLYATPADPIDAMADFETMIAVWGRGACGVQSPFVAAGSVASGTREFATALASWRDLLFSAHPSGIRVWKAPSTSARELASAAVPPLVLRTVLRRSYDAPRSAASGRGSGSGDVGGAGGLDGHPADPPTVVAMAVVESAGALCVAAGHEIFVWQPREWHGGEVLAYSITARMSHPGSISSLLTVCGDRLVSADADAGWVCVWDVSCKGALRADHHEDPWSEDWSATLRRIVEAGGCSSARAAAAELERTIETGGLLTKWYLNSYLSAVNCLAHFRRGRDAGVGEEAQVAGDEGLGWLYSGHDASAAGADQVARWW
jgi:hypothetical protein